MATDSLPGVREILGNNDYGIITPVGDYKTLGKTIYMMYQDKEKYKSYKLKSKQKFKEFSPDIIMEKLRVIFE